MHTLKTSMLTIVLQIGMVYHGIESVPAKESSAHLYCTFHSGMSRNERSCPLLHSVNKMKSLDVHIRMFNVTKGFLLSVRGDVNLILADLLGFVDL